MKRSQATGDDDGASPSKEPKLVDSENQKLRTAGARVTRSFLRKVSVAKMNKDQEKSVLSIRKSNRLTTSQRAYEREKQTCTQKSLDAPLLQYLSNSDLTGILKILKAAKLGNCSFTQRTLDNALLSASRQGFLFVVQTLLSLGANIESSDRDGNTALLLSVERKSVEMVEFLLKKGANAKAVRKSTGDSCLLLAVQPEGLFQIFKLLVEHGSNILLENKKGDTALSRALEVGNVKVIYFLMKSGATADWCNKFGKTARSVANGVGLSNLLTSMSSLKEGVPALVKAVKMKDVQLLEILLDNKVENVDDLYWKNNISLTALEFALEKMGVRPDRATSQTLKAMITLLLKEGASVNRNYTIKSNAQLAKSPLIIAAKVGNCDLVDLLIRYGAKKFFKGLQAALMAGNVNCAEFLFKKVGEKNFSDLAVRVASTKHVKSFRFLYDKCWVKTTDSRLMHAAIVGGHLNMVRLLIKLGANVSARGECSMPFLYYANDVRMASFLVDQGADMNATWVEFNSMEVRRFTALTFAIREKRTDLVKFYLSRGADTMLFSSFGGLRVLQTLSVNPSVEILDMLLAAGVDINHVDRYGESTLMWAIKEKNLQLLKLLIDKRADVTLSDENGISPLMCAVDSRYSVCEEAVECLISAGADVNSQDKDGNSALIHCFNSPNVYGLKKLKCLVEAGASVNCQNKNGMTALSVHMKFFSFETTKALLEVGADVNIISKNGNTPLMTLVNEKPVLLKENLQLFLDHGADLNFVNTKGRESTTALSLALCNWIRQRFDPFYYRHEEKNDSSAFTILLQAGADPNLGEASKLLMHWAIVFNQRWLIPTLITSGLCPYEYEYKHIRDQFALPPSSYSILVSPFKLALYLGKLSIAKYLADLSFFTEGDIGQGYKWTAGLQDHLRSKGYLKTLNYINEFTLGPKSLIDLSSVVVSTRLQDSLSRKKAVMSTGLPSLLQNRLLYEHTCVKLGSDVDETSQNEQYSHLIESLESENEEDDFESFFGNSSSYSLGSDYEFGYF